MYTVQSNFVHQPHAVQDSWRGVRRQIVEEAVDRAIDHSGRFLPAHSLLLTQAPNGGAHPLPAAQGHHDTQQHQVTPRAQAQPLRQGPVEDHQLAVGLVVQQVSRVGIGVKHRRVFPGEQRHRNERLDQLFGDADAANGRMGDRVGHFDAGLLAHGRDLAAAQLRDHSRHADSDGRTVGARRFRESGLLAREIELMLEQEPDFGDHLVDLADRETVAALL